MAGREVYQESRFSSVTWAIVAGILTTIVVAVALFAFDFVNPFDDGDPEPETADLMLREMSNLQAGLIASGAVLDTSYVNVSVRHEGESSEDWKTHLTGQPHDRIEVQVRFENVSIRRAEDVAVGINLPAFMDYVPGSTMLMNGSHPEGIALSSDNVVSGGVYVGDYNTEAVGYLKITTTLDPPTTSTCGEYEVVVTGLVGSDAQNTVYNTAKVDFDLSEPDCGAPN